MLGENKMALIAICPKCKNSFNPVHSVSESMICNSCFLGERYPPPLPNELTLLDRLVENTEQIKRLGEIVMDLQDKAIGIKDPKKVEPREFWIKPTKTDTDESLGEAQLRTDRPSVWKDSWIHVREVTE